MAPRILACFLFALSLQAGDLAGWSWIPGHTTEESGIAFSFIAPPTTQAQIVALVRDCGRERTVKATVDTDAIHGDTVLHMPICSLDGFSIRRITITFGDASTTEESPQTGRYYRYPLSGPPRR